MTFDENNGNLPATISADTATLPVIARTAEQYAAHAIPASTQRAYRSAWSTFETWCASNDLQSMPADPASVADYLTSRANAGTKVATMSLALSAIVAAHRLSGHQLDTKTGLLAATWKGIRRQCVTAQRQAEPLGKADVVEAIKLLGTDAKGLRDRALLAFGLMAARRRSELAGLDLGRIGAGDGYVVISPAGIEIVLLRSKSQDGEAKQYTIARQHAPVAVAALESWINASKIVDGSPLFRGVMNDGRVCDERISDKAIARAIKSAMTKLAKSRGMTKQEAEQFAAPYSGHSLRVGFAVEAVNAGVGHELVADHMGHSSTDMTRRYSKKAARGMALGKIGL